ncbi:MAG: hypothetical protein MUE60_01510 [Candidatus Eisenbacteria bacterium]|jgi:hypothetical protein|nr:hypothetical protein [Candidatus Eisenbacteria bacterium]
MLMLIARVLRLLLILLALRYVWKAVRAAFAPPPPVPRAGPGRQEHPVMGDAEDIEYEELP